MIIILNHSNIVLVTGLLVHQEHLTDHVDKVENLAGQELDEVERVLSPMYLDILDDCCDPF